MSLRKYFQTCLDLPNIEGAFCLSKEGELVESFMPPPYTDDIFQELGTRVVTLTEAVDMSYAQTQEILLHFESHSLYLRKSEFCIIGIFVRGNPLLSGLKITVNLLLKQAQAEILQASKNAAPRPSQPAAAPPAPVEEDDIIIEPNLPQKETTTDHEKRGLFGRKKEKKQTSNDIWG
ncbi:MAG: hypothetical protein AAF546_00470 [Verrucomicrobiota bacterium]